MLHHKCSLSIISFTTIISSAFFCNSLHAKEVIFAGIAGLSHTSVDISTNQFGGDKVSLQMYKVGLLVQHDKWTMKWTIDTPIETEDLKFNDIMGVNKFDYSSGDISIAYKVNDNVSVYAGYLNTNFSFDNNTLFQSFGGSGVYNQNYDELGSYAGVNYRMSFKHGVLNLSLAYASLDATFEDNMYEAQLPGLRLDGDTTGLSYGISWQGSINKKIKYSVGLSARRYEFDSNLKSGIPEFPGLGAINDDSFDSDWNMDTASINVIYIF